MEGMCDIVPISYELQELRLQVGRCRQVHEVRPLTVEDREPLLDLIAPGTRHRREMDTDAKRGKPSLCEAAAGGTLFLDEIEALLPALQHKLLTAIEAKRIRRLGREKALGWPSPQYQGSAVFSLQGKTSLRNTVIKPFQSKAVAGSTSPVALWV
jgi:sigma54-dependent transcription regulator